MIKIRDNNQGIIAVLALMAVSVFALAIITTVSMLATTDLKNSIATVSTEQAFTGAEAGVNEGLYRIKWQMDNDPGNPFIGPLTLTQAQGMPSGVTSVVTISSNGFQRTVKAVATDTTGKSRTLQVTVNTNTFAGGGFSNALQAGNGGIDMEVNDTINGDIYTNGSITGHNNVTINGNTTVANLPTTLAQQATLQNADFPFGLAVSGTNYTDAAQAFIPSSSGNIKKISLNIKKVGNPGNITLRILTNNAGSPSKTIIANGTATLNASQVSTNYAWIDVPFDQGNPLPQVTAATTYWIMLDGSNNSSNYWVWGKDSSDSYANGTGKYSANWNAGVPVWSSATGDLNFKVWTGTVDTVIDNIRQINGSARANTISNTTISSDAWYQSISGSTVGGVSHPGSPDPIPLPLPVTLGNITTLKNSIIGASPTIKSPNCNSNQDYCVTTAETFAANTIVNGNLQINSDLTIQGNVWVKGKITVNNNIHVNTGSHASAFLIADNCDPGTGCDLETNETSNENDEIIEGGGAQVDSNYSDVFLVMVTTSNKSGTSNPAIDAGSNNNNLQVLVAVRGTLYIKNNGTFNAAACNQIAIKNNLTVNYSSAITQMYIPGPSNLPKLVLPSTDTWQEQ